MTNLVDRLRADPPTERHIAVFGFDPDLHHSGWARIVATYTTPATAIRFIVASLDTIDIPLRLKSTSAADAMGAAIVEHGVPYLRGLPPAGQAYAVVETQEIYANRDAPAQKLVGQGNDMIRLAQVSGAAFAVFTAAGVRSRSFLPKTWKKQAQKTAMWAAAARRLHGHCVGDFTAPTTEKDPRSHAWDALCMALWGVDQVAAGLWR